MVDSSGDPAGVGARGAYSDVNVAEDEHGSPFVWPFACIQDDVRWNPAAVLVGAEKSKAIGEK